MSKKILLTGLVVLGIGCQSLPHVRDEHLPRGTRGLPNPPQQNEATPEKPIRPIVGFTSLGTVVIFDGQTGEISSTAEGGGGHPRDVAMDPWRAGVWVFEENEDAQGGEIRFCPLEKGFDASGLPTRLRACEHAVWIDGLASMLPTEDGLWVFEDGIGGARWKILSKGQITPSVSVPRPVSIWMQDGEIEALTFGFQNDRLQIYRADVGASGPDVYQEYDWGEPLGNPPTARYAWLSNDAGLLFDAVGNALTVRQVDAGVPGLSRAIDVGIDVPRIEAAVGRGASALVLGRDALWIVAVNDASVRLVSGLWLHGDVRDSPLFFSRDLLVAEDRAFVGTDRGVRAFGLENDGETVVNAYPDETFVGEGLRGPFDAVRSVEK